MNDGSYYTQIRRSVKAFELEFEQTRRDRMHIVAAMAGPYFGDDDTGTRPDDGEQPLPLMQMNALSWMIHLTTGRAKTLVSCNRPGHEFKTKKIRLHLDDAMNRFGWAEFEARFMLDAITGPFAIAKVGRTSGHGAFGGYDLYIDTVSVDDFVYDLSARRWKASEHEYMGHAFDIDRDTAVDELGISKKRLDEIQSLKRRDSSDRVSDMFGKSDDDREWMRLYELHLPQLGRICLFDSEGPFVPLDERPGKIGEDVPMLGLYRPLVFNRLPDSLLGLGLLAPSFDESRNANSAQVKYIKSVLGSARFLTVQNGADEDAKQIKAAKDGDVRTIMGTKESVQDRTRGAPDAGAFSASQTSMANFDRAAHGMSMRLGMDAGAETATEVNDRAAASSAVQRYVRRLAHEAKEDVLRMICWWSYNKLGSLEYPIRDGESRYTFRANEWKGARKRDVRTGAWVDDEPMRFDEYDFRLSTFGGDALEPRQLLAIQSQMLAEYMQAPQLFAQQSVIPNIQAMQRNKMRWTNTEGAEGMDDIFITTTKEIDTEGLSANGPPKQNGQNKPYFRTARSGKQDGQSDALAMASMMNQGGAETP